MQTCLSWNLRKISERSHWQNLSFLGGISGFKCGQLTISRCLTGRYPKKRYWQFMSKNIKICMGYIVFYWFSLEISLGVRILCWNPQQRNTFYWGLCFLYGIPLLLFQAFVSMSNLRNCTMIAILKYKLPTWKDLLSCHCPWSACSRGRQLLIFLS